MTTNTITLTENQATEFFGSDWCQLTGQTVMFDGFEVVASVEANSLTLEAEGVDFSDVYGD